MPLMIWKTGAAAVTGPLVVTVGENSYTFEGGGTSTFVEKEHAAAATTAVQNAVPGSTLTAASE